MPEARPPERRLQIWSSREALRLCGRELSLYRRDVRTHWRPPPVIHMICRHTQGGRCRRTGGGTHNYRPAAAIPIHCTSELSFSAVELTPAVTKAAHSKAIGLSLLHQHQHQHHSHPHPHPLLAAPHSSSHPSMTPPLTPPKMSKMWEVDPETRSKLLEIQKTNENSKCVDCGAPSPQWVRSTALPDRTAS